MITPEDVILKLSSIVTHLECPICLSVIEDTHIIPDCGHRFCGSCIKESLRKCNNACPSCRVHVSTTRRLRADDLFDNLIQKLSCIIEESTDDTNDIDLKILLDSLRALLWHFQCPICSNELEDTQISSECLHRFCRSCISNQTCITRPSPSSKLTGASTSSSTLVSRTETEKDSGLAAAQSRHVGKCPFCVHQDQTVFFPDKQYESINKAIRSIIKTIEDAEGDDIIEMDGEEEVNELSGEFGLMENAHETDTAIENEFQNSSWGDHEDFLHGEDPFSVEGFDFDRKDLDAALPYDIASELPSNEVLNHVESATTAGDGEGDSAVSQPLPTEDTQAISIETTVNKSVRFDANITTPDESEVLPPKPKKQKYKTGSRFIQTDSQKCGRILGFRDGYYQVFFPHDKSCHNYTEQDFNLTKFIKPHKRPTQTPKVQSQDRGDSVLCCPRCKSRFSSNPDDDASGRAPVQSQNCAHVICVDCVQSIRMTSLPKNGGNSNRKLRVTVDCPFCKKLKSFNAIDPTICVAMCQMVSLYEQMEHQKKEDKIRRKIKDEEDREKYCGETIHKKRKQSTRTQKKTHEEPKKARTGGKHASTRSTSHGHKKSSHFRCKVCKQEKVVEKFSSKQLEKVKQKSRPICRRCEEKGILRKQLGGGADKVSTTVKVAKKHGSKPKFLTTIVPWHEGKAITDSTPLPSDLTIDGYTRDPWGLFESNNTEEEKCWTKCSFWSSGNGMAPFIQFLRDNKKSAYGTFLVNQTDGFFVIPFDQSAPKGTSRTNIFQCKYVTGLGLLEELSSNEPTTQNVSCPTDPNMKGEEREQKSGSLQNLLATEYKTSKSLSIVPKGSVKAAKKISSCPEGPAPSFGPTNWYRQRIVIRDEGEGNSSDDGIKSNRFDNKMEAEGSNDSLKYEL